MSTIADIVIALGFRKEREKISRILTVLKARGIGHDTRVREVVFEKGRVRLK